MLSWFFLAALAALTHVFAVTGFGATAALVHWGFFGARASHVAYELPLLRAWQEPLWYRRARSLSLAATMLAGLTLTFVGIVMREKGMISLGMFVGVQILGVPWLMAVLHQVRITAVGRAFIASAHFAAVSVPFGMSMLLLGAATSVVQAALLGIVAIAPAAVLTLLRMSVIQTQDEPHLLFDDTSPRMPYEVLPGGRKATPPSKP